MYAAWPSRYDRGMQTLKIVPMASALATDANQLIEAFLAGRNAKTIRAYSKDLVDFQTFLGARSITNAAELLLGTDHGKANLRALQYRAHLTDRKLQPATINRRLAALRSLVQMARILGMVPWKLEVQNVKSTPYRDTKGPGKEGFRSLLQTVEKKTTGKAVRDKAILRLLYDLALRSGELVALDLGDLDLAKSSVSILGKGRTEKETLTMPQPTKEALENWLQMRGRDPGPLFLNFDPAKKGNRLTQTSLYRIIRRLGEKNGFKTRPHALRHTAITEAVKMAQMNNFGLEEVCDYSRHRSVAALMVYRDRERNVQGQLSALVANSI